MPPWWLCGDLRHRKWRLGWSSWFSSLDLCSGYLEVELAPDARPKTAFTIGQGLWQFGVMPFGLCNAPATFEWLMERVLADVPHSHCIVYLDNLLVHANDRALFNLWDALTSIRPAGLWLNPAKCHLLTRETEFLGHVVSGNVGVGAVLSCHSRREMESGQVLQIVHVSVGAGHYGNSKTLHRLGGEGVYHSEQHCVSCEWLCTIVPEHTVPQ